MNRAVSKFIKETMGLKKWATHSVERWIGFAYDETKRAAKMNLEDHRQQVRYPLIDMQMTRTDVEDWYGDTGEEQPPRSVCNHCWANGIGTFQRISEQDPEGWDRAKKYDEAARDLSQFGVRQATYCSRSLVPLQTLEDNGFDLNGRDSDILSCDSGYCFT
jgi:hypothetical protein